MPKKNNQIQTEPVGQNEIEKCISCAAQVRKSNGPTHRYIGASPGCWAIFGEVLAKEYGDYRYPQVHRLTIDVYAAQHPGKPSKQSIQSVTVHLIGLHIMLDQNFDAQWTTKAIKKASQFSENYVWLEPPASSGELTILDVQGAANLKEHTDRVHIWAHSVWRAWESHHEQIRLWAKRIE